MTRDELRATMSTWLGEILEGPPPALTDDLDLMADVGLDSLGVAELAAKARQKLKVKLVAQDVAKDLRVGPLIDLVLSRLP